MGPFLRRAALMAAFLGMVASLGFATDETPKTGFLSETLTHDGKAYAYMVYVPPKYDAAKNWPLILFLHGAGESGTDGRRQIDVGLGSAIKANPDKWPFIAVFPQKPDLIAAWEEYDAPLMEMVAKARKDYNVDERRMYLTGLSMGGHGTWIMGARHADMWAAVAPICGYAGLPDSDPNQKFDSGYTTVTDFGLRVLLYRSWPNGRSIRPDTIKAMARDLKTTPLWAFHGDKDITVPYEETTRLIAAVKAAGGKPKMTIFPGVDHNSWDKAYREMGLADWFLSHRRPARP